MTETYEAIIEEIKQFNKKKMHCWGNDAPAMEYCSDKGISSDDYAWCMTAVALDIAARVREAVGGDPSEWWVEDADGNRTHIGDEIVGSDFCGTRTVKGFYCGEKDIMHVITGIAEHHSRGRVHKVIPDTREKIIEDTLDKLDQTGMYRTSLVTESVVQAVDRAMKLGAGR